MLIHNAILFTTSNAEMLPGMENSNAHWLQFFLLPNLFLKKMFPEIAIYLFYNSSYTVSVTYCFLHVKT